MSPRWYAEAASTVWHVLQRTKLVRDTGKTSYEMQTGTKPDLKHLRSWGCFAMVLLDGDHPVRFIGYSLNTKEYKFALLPNLMTIVLSRDAVFNETTFSLAGIITPSTWGRKKKQVVRS